MDECCQCWNAYRLSIFTPSVQPLILIDPCPSLAKYLQRLAIHAYHVEDALKLLYAKILLAARDEQYPIDLLLSKGILPSQFVLHTTSTSYDPFPLRLAEESKLKLFFTHLCLTTKNVPRMDPMLIKHLYPVYSKRKSSTLARGMPRSDVLKLLQDKGVSIDFLIALLLYGMIHAKDYVRREYRQYFVEHKFVLNWKQFDDFDIKIRSNVREFFQSGIVAPFYLIDDTCFNVEMRIIHLMVCDGIFDLIVPYLPPNISYATHYKMVRYLSIHQRRKATGTSDTCALLNWMNDNVQGGIDKLLRHKLKLTINRKFQSGCHYTEFFCNMQKFYRERLAWRECDH